MPCHKTHGLYAWHLLQTTSDTQAQVHVEKIKTQIILMAKKSPHPARIGFVISPHSNNSFLLKGQKNLKRCPCGELLSRECDLSQFRLKKKRDISASEDSELFASNHFRQVWLEFGGEGLEFEPLPAQPGYYHLVFNDILEFDSIRRMSRAEDFRPCCQRNVTFVGATPAYLKRPEALEGNHAYRTDLEFGSGDEKHPLLIVGLNVGLKLKGSKISGLCLADVLA